MVLDQGKVVEFDTPNQLLSNNHNIFYLMAHQAGLI